MKAIRGTITLSDLRAQDIAPAAHEAVAVVLTLVEGKLEGSTPARAPGAPLAPLPSPSTITLTSDGTASCSETLAALSTVEIAAVLQDILEDTPQVPPGLLYAIARALQVVEAPPFDSPAAFCAALARFERGARRHVVSGLVGRCGAAVESKSLGGRRPERRRTTALVAQLRRELRAADRWVYEQQAVQMPARTLGSRALPRFAPAAVAVCFTAGLASVAIGDSMNRVPTGRLEVLPKVAMAAASGDRAPAIESPAPSGATAIPTTRATSLPNPNIAPRRAASIARKSASPRKTASRPTVASRLGAALRFGWVRRFITIKNDL